jgi:hypothetical protein
MHFATRYKTWWITLLSAYLVSFLWLGAFIVCVPVVIVQAPLSLTSLFHPPLYAAAARVTLGPPEICLHVVFWSLFFCGAFGCKKLPAKAVISIYAFVVILLLLTLARCSQHYQWSNKTIN